MRLKRLIVFFLILIILGLISVYSPGFTSKTIYEPEPALVLRAVDGDTLETDIGTVRLLGVNTPERGKPGYQEAKAFLSQLENQTVELLRDRENKDKYDRLLRYVFYNDRLINLEILEGGLGSAYLTSGLKYEDKFLRAEQQAQNSGDGMWSASGAECSQCIELVELNSTEEFFILKNICNQDCNLEGWTVKDAGRKTFKLEEIAAGDEVKIESDRVWNNDGDQFFLRDSQGDLVLYYEY